MSVKKAITLTEPEAAAKIGIHPSTLAQLRRKGKVPSWRQIGRKVKYTPEDVERFIASTRRGQLEDYRISSLTDRVAMARFG